MVGVKIRRIENGRVKIRRIENGRVKIRKKIDEIMVGLVVFSLGPSNFSPQI